MEEYARKQINIKASTSERLDMLKAIPSESYDSIINRIIDEVLKR